MNKTNFSDNSNSDDETPIKPVPKTKNVVSSKKSVSKDTKPLKKTVDSDMEEDFTPKETVDNDDEKKKKKLSKDKTKKNLKN